MTDSKRTTNAIVQWIKVAFYSLILIELVVIVIGSYDPQVTNSFTYFLGCMEVFLSGEFNNHSTDSFIMTPVTILSIIILIAPLFINEDAFKTRDKLIAIFFFFLSLFRLVIGQMFPQTGGFSF